MHILSGGTKKNNQTRKKYVQQIVSLLFVKTNVYNPKTNV